MTIKDDASQTTITADALVARGYREFPSTTDEAKRLFQKRIDDDRGARYFVNFREWDHPKRVVSFDAQICCDTNSHGYCWATIKEDSIEQAEARAEAIWLAMGSVYYDA